MSENDNYSLFMIVLRESSRDSLTLLSTISNVPTSNTAMQITCVTTISHLKISNGRISALFGNDLKNRIFFNIIRSDYNICTLKSERNQCRGKMKHVHDCFHKQHSFYSEHVCCRRKRGGGKPLKKVVTITTSRLCPLIV